MRFFSPHISIVQNHSFFPSLCKPYIFVDRNEEEARQKAAVEEQARRAEQRRREAEALKKLQERSKAPWAQAPQAPPPTSHTSLAEIQRLEREKKAVSLPPQLKTS